MVAALLNSARVRPARTAVIALSLTMLFAAGLAPTAGAAPQASTSCGGTLKRTPTVDQPNQVTYSFLCSEDIFAYSLIVNRTFNNRSQLDVVDVFSPGADVYYSPAEYGLTPTIVPDESFACEGAIPGTGFNCATSSKTPGARARHSVLGTFSTADPLCGGTPTDAPKNSTVILPPAFVQLVVTNTSGATNGPFRIGPAKECPKIKPKPTPKPKVCTKKGKKVPCPSGKGKRRGKVKGK
jgi:hypothetical protein